MRESERAKVFVAFLFAACRPPEEPTLWRLRGEQVLVELGGSSASAILGTMLRLT